MKKMRAVQVARPGGPFQVVEREVPEPGPGEARVKVEACGICHSDAVVKGGHYPGLTLPRIPGHEVAGRIDALGSGVPGWEPGQRVGVGWYGGHCGHCDHCRRGDFVNCRNGKITGVTFDGGYAEYLVAPVQALVRIPDALDAAAAGPLVCAGITTFNALRNSGARPGDTVAVQGIGGLGHLGIQYASKLGFRTVALSHGADKEAMARELGAHDYVDTSKQSAAEGLQRLGGAHVVLATAPHADAIGSTVAGLVPRGKLLIVAVASEPIPVSALSLLSGKCVAGWPAGASIDSEATLAFSARTGVRARIERFPLDQADAAFARMMDNKVRFRAVLIP
ncbi:MAG TPA: alcohol dehydrogenase [Planctomycetota bacterium]